MHEVLAEWSEVTLADMALPERGSTTIGPFGSDLVADDYRDGGVSVVFVRDIHDNGFKRTSNVYVNAAKARALVAHNVRSGDLILTKMGMPPCVAAVYPKNMPNGIITADIVRMRPNTRIVDARWLAFVINHESIRKQVRAITGGVTRPKVTLADVRTLKTVLPPLGEQRRIAEVIDSLDERISAGERVVEKLQIFHNALTRGQIAEVVDSVCGKSHSKLWRTWQAELRWDLSRRGMVRRCCRICA